jgi:glycosyltransferase involved in cell wall biosynthesis
MTAPYGDAALPPAVPLRQTEAPEPGRLLLITSIVPWPLRRNGFSLRFAPIIEYLSRRYELDLLVLAEDEESATRDGALSLCRSVTVIRVPVRSLSRAARKISVAWSGLLPWTAPLGASRNFEQRELEREVSERVASKPYTVVLWAAGHLDVAWRVRRRFPQVRFVVDFVDSPTLAISRAKIARRVLRFLSRYTNWKWRRLERKVQRTFDATIYISTVDATAVQPLPDPRVHVIPNGVTFSDAGPDSPKKTADRPVIGYLGDMSYPPNISAVLRLAHRIFPPILESTGSARLLIIGRNPSEEIRRLHSAEITVTGSVENIWAHINQVNVFVFPMLEGSGLQNKILEAMYAQVPVVTTSMSAAGIGAKTDVQLLTGDADEEIVRQSLKLLCDTRYAQEMARRGKEFVMQEFNWQSILPRYEQILFPASQRALS